MFYCDSTFFYLLFSSAISSELAERNSTKTGWSPSAKSGNGNVCPSNSTVAEVERRRSSSSAVGVIAVSARQVADWRWRHVCTVWLRTYCATRPADTAARGKSASATVRPMVRRRMPRSQASNLSTRACVRRLMSAPRSRGIMQPFVAYTVRRQQASRSRQVGVVRSTARLHTTTPSEVHRVLAREDWNRSTSACQAVGISRQTVRSGVLEPAHLSTSSRSTTSS